MTAGAGGELPKAAAPAGSKAGGGGGVKGWIAAMKPPASATTHRWVGAGLCCVGNKHTTQLLCVCVCVAQVLTPDRKTAADSLLLLHVCSPLPRLPVCIRLSACLLVCAIHAHGHTHAHRKWNSADGSGRDGGAAKADQQQRWSSNGGGSAVSGSTTSGEGGTHSSSNGNSSSLWSPEVASAMGYGKK